MVKRKLAFRKKRQNRLAMFLVTMAVLMLLIVVGIKSIELREKQRVYAAKEIALEQQIAAEEKRAEEVEEFRKYTKTKKYAEEVAKDRLGLVHDGEIIFKEKE
ncbi:MAG: septum formation initiator family protein [Lachnospiraceae bacterium]|nr:septum formation initiator family protein [Lachnospiraceae bacterium]